MYHFFLLSLLSPAVLLAKVRSIILISTSMTTSAALRGGAKIHIYDLRTKREPVPRAHTFAHMDSEGDIAGPSDECRGGSYEGGEEPTGTFLSRVDGMSVAWEKMVPSRIIGVNSPGAHLTRSADAMQVEKRRNRQSTGGGSPPRRPRLCRCNRQSRGRQYRTVRRGPRGPPRVST